MAVQDIAQTVPRELLATERVLQASIVTVLSTAVVGVALGSAAFSGVPSGGQTLALEGTPGEVLVQIVVRNLSAALFMFSGYLTFGSTTLLGLTLTSIYVGATGAAMIRSGLDQINTAAVLYVPFEFGGLLMVAVAGVLPLVSLAYRWLGSAPVPAQWSTRRSLGFASAGAALILLGALIETVVIVAVGW